MRGGGVGEMCTLPRNFVKYISGLVVRKSPIVDAKEVTGVFRLKMTNVTIRRPRRQCVTNAKNAEFIGINDHYRGLHNAEFGLSGDPK